MGGGFDTDPVDIGVPLNSQVLSELPTKLRHLTPDQQRDVTFLLHEFPSVFSDVPSRTDIIQHDVELTSHTPLKQAPHRVNPEKREIIRREVEYMSEHGIVEPSCSSYSASCVLVKKDGGKSFRLCQDYRKLNNVPVPDSFPLSRIDICIDNVGHAKFVSTFDLLKGYW